MRVIQYSNWVTERNISANNYNQHSHYTSPPAAVVMPSGEPEASVQTAHFSLSVWILININNNTRTSTATYEFGLSCVCNHGTVNCNRIFRGLKIHIFICIQKDFSQETLEHILCVLIWSERLGAQPEEEARGSDEQMLACVSRSIVSCEGNHETVSQFRFVTSKICFHADFHYQLSQNFNSDIFFIQLNIPLSFWCILICIS